MTNHPSRMLTFEEIDDIEKHYRYGRFMQNDFDWLANTARAALKENERLRSELRNISPDGSDKCEPWISNGP